ncbi:MAG: alanine racemase, partial [Rudaea sp.]|nr:alanine racemase [Rudaea sp.]
MARTLAQIDTPALVLDRTRLERNIARMRERTAALGVALRPHMKTTKSADIARRGAGAGITVSTLREAEYFAAHGHTDIFYAVAIAPQKLERAAALMRGGVRLLLA